MQETDTHTHFHWYTHRLSLHKSCEQWFTVIVWAFRVTKDTETYLCLDFEVNLWRFRAPGTSLPLFFYCSHRGRLYPEFVVSDWMRTTAAGLELRPLWPDRHLCFYISWPQGWFLSCSAQSNKASCQGFIMNRLLGRYFTSQKCIRWLGFFTSVKLFLYFAVLYHEKLFNKLVSEGHSKP